MAGPIFVNCPFPVSYQYGYMRVAFVVFPIPRIPHLSERRAISAPWAFAQGSARRADQGKEKGRDIFFPKAPSEKI